MSRKNAFVQLGDERYELEEANTATVTLVHLSTGERRIIPNHELASLLDLDERRSARVMDSLPHHVLEAAEALAVDIEEVVTGVGRNGKCRAQYDLATTSQETRLARKLEEMEFAGRPMDRSSFFRKINDYKRDGLIGLVDGRALRKFKKFKCVAWQVEEALITVIDDQKDRSTGTTSRIIHETKELVQEKYGPVRLPGKSTFYELVEAYGGGKHATGSAKTRRSLGNRPDRTFAKNEQLMPGAQVQIDTNTMDIEVRTPDGQRVRPLLSIMTDVYTRSIISFTMRMEGTKAVDHTMLLAQACTPRQNRPPREWWRDAVLRNSPGVKLLSDEEYAAHSRALPFIRPNGITVDRGTDYVSKTFRSAATQLGCSVVLSAPYTPTSKPHVERQFHTVNSMFTQYLDGYLGRSPEHKGRELPIEKLHTVETLRELFDDWVISVWQNHKHSELRDPLHKRRLFSQNEMAARAALTVEQLRVTFTRDDYIRMLDSHFRTIGSTGVRTNNRKYDSELLHKLKGRKSDFPRHGGKWEVKVDPYNPTCVWVVGPSGELIECPERGLEMRWYAPEFAPAEEDYRTLTAQSDAELTGTPYPVPALQPLPEYTADVDFGDGGDATPLGTEF